MKKFVAFLVTALLLSGLAAISYFGLRRGSPDRDIQSALLGKPAPDFELPVYQRYQNDYGPLLKLSDYEGKPVVINFWATWCVSCIQEAPTLERIWQKYKDKALIIGVQTLEKGKESAGNSFLTRFDLSFPSVMDRNNDVSVDYGIFGLPETFFIHPNGTIYYKFVGPIDAQVFGEKIEEMLK